MTVEFKKAFRFNLEASKPEEIKLANEMDDLNTYLHQLIEDVIGDDRSKKYLFPADETQLKTAISQIITGGNRGTTALSSAKRLLRVELNVQDRIEHLNREVQKGIMLQALVKYNKQTLFLIIKAEHFDFINEKDNKKTTGLPIKKKIFKSFCAYLDKSNTPLYANVSDYRTVISTYWWKDFLELEEEYTDEHNTERSFDALEKKVLNPIKEAHPRDYMYLRNATVQYFRSHEEFVLSDYTKTIISRYKPEDDNLYMNTLEDKIIHLPEKQKFDNRFNIVKDKIKKRIIKRIQLTRQLDLVVKENINWNNSVSAVVEEGVKYIKIRTDEGYKYFKAAENS